MLEPYITHIYDTAYIVYAPRGSDIYCAGVTEIAGYSSVVSEQSFYKKCLKWFETSKNAVRNAKERV